tara:strand:+ start:221 stop:1312 length:1092 start_codon:yes stop_codon:yes gene_type:complete
MPKTKKNNKIRKNKTRKYKPIHISSNFESGNIIHKSSKCDSKLNHIIDLEIREEPYPKYTKRKYKNWFYFKATNIKSKTKFNINNIRNYFNDWKGYTVCYSYNNKTWKRMKTKLNIDKKRLSWEINPKKSTMWFAFYPPYPFSKSKKLLSNMQTIGYTKEKRPILMKKLGNGPKRVWLISGQHSGETINSWILEGFVKRVLERKLSLFKKFTFYIIPNANPDGNFNGHWYVTKQGINLNRDWLHTKSNEVKAIKKQMEKYGYDLVFDLHGDEGCKKHFLVHSYGCKPPYFDVINKKLNKKNRHFQLENYYDDVYMKGAKDTLDDYTRGITVEGCMKHPIYNHKTIQDEPLKIGKDLADVFTEL